MDMMRGNKITCTKRKEASSTVEGNCVMEEGSALSSSHGNHFELGGLERHVKIRDQHPWLDCGGARQL